MHHDLGFSLKILHFLSQETASSNKPVLFFAAIAGIANSLLLIIISQAAGQLHDKTIETQLFIIYLVTFILFAYAQRVSQRQAITAVEQAVENIRLRITNKIRHCELHTIEKLSSISHYSVLSQGTSTISQSVMHLLSGVEALLVLILASLYLLWLSPASFFITLGIAGITVSLLVRHYHNTFQKLRQASGEEQQFFEYLTSLLKGFKQVKTHQQDCDLLFEQTKHYTHEAKTLRTQANINLWEDKLLSDSSAYLLLLLIVFILPIFTAEREDNLLQIIATVIFMIKPVAMLSAAIPNISRTDVAIDTIYALDKKLDQNREELSTPDKRADSQFAAFPSLQLQNISFSYEATKFKLVVPDIHIKRGETIFITGKNGSGKSSFLKLLTGLYHPQQGTLHIGDYRLQDEDFGAYRELFSVVFDDFYLFEHLREKIKSKDKDKEINDWLAHLSLNKKEIFDLKENNFRHLSLGEHKRLAFLTAVLRHQPVLILDDFISQQDTSFKQYFYKDILTILQQYGKTIIMVSYDDEYFSVADKILHIENGYVRQQDRSSKALSKQ